MPLTIKVLSYKGLPPEEPLSACFDRQGGTLGRISENHFVLPDPDRYVSRKHAYISYENGYYCLTDTSTAGTFVTNKDLLLHRNKTQLANGDALRIGDYDLVVSILSNDALEATPYSATSQAKDFSFFNFDEDLSAKGKPGVRDIISEDKAFTEPESDPFDLDPKPNQFKDHFEGSPLGDSFVPPETASPEQAHVIPQDFNINELFDESGEIEEADDHNGQTGDISSDPTLLLKDTLNEQKHQRGSDEKFNESRPPIDELLDTPDDLEKAIDNTGQTGDISSDPTLLLKDTLDEQKRQRGSDEKFNEFKFPDDLASSVEQPKKQIKKAPPAVRSKKAPVSDVVATTPEATREAYGDLLNVFFEAAGIADTSFLPREEYQEAMRTAGAVFRELIDGLMTVLQGRAELKSQFRVTMTFLKSAENNPLKFSPTATEALKLLLVKNQPGFVDAVDAVREGFQDIMNHQLAITAGIQASLMNLLTKFDPQNFASHYEEGFVLGKKAKCWDAYRQAYGELVKEALENFFGEEFARAYEEQMLKLRTSLKKG
jgi:type VI secretion system FHA domain protein